MKVKNIITTALYTTLAVASLGYATPTFTTEVSPALQTHYATQTFTTEVSPALQTHSPNKTTTLPTALDAINATGALGGLSQECQTALFSIVVSPEFLKCIPVTAIAALIPLVIDPTIIPKFLADPVHNYTPLEKPLLDFATAFCPAPICSDKGVDGAIAAILSGCKDDLAKKNELVQLLLDAAVFYSPIKNVTCFTDGKAFCWDESILTAISLPPSKFNITGNNLTDSIAVADPEKVCTKCNKNIINTFLNFLITNTHKDLVKQILEGFKIDDKAIGFFKLGVAVKCGQNFEDGKIVK